MNQHPSHKTNLGHKHSIAHALIISLIITFIVAVFLSTFSLSWATVLGFSAPIWLAAMTLVYILLIGRK